MRIAVINLPSQQARWKAARRQFERLGVAAERVEAVDGSRLPLHERARLYDEALNREQYHKALRPGEIGCYSSHLQVWQQLVDSGERALAIFEDDIEVAPDLPEVLAALERTGSPWDLVKLMGRPRERIKTRVQLTGRRDLIEYSRVPSHTGAYVLSRRGALKLLARRRPFGRPVDVDLRHWWECDIAVLGVHDYPVVQAPASDTTTIDGRNGPCDWSTRVHKLVLQARYSCLNWRHGRSAGSVDWHRGLAPDASINDPWSVR